MNSVVLIRRLTKDPDLRYIPVTGTPVATFTLAVDKQLSKDKKQELESRNQPTADFIRIVAWGKMGENCANYLKKGLLTAVQGRIQNRSYELGDGTKRYITEVVASNVEFLEWADSKQDNTNDGFGDIEGFHPVYDDDIPF